VVAFEDLHWADPTSLDLMRALAERGAQAPLLIVATARPEFRPPWSVRSHHSAISLSPLDSAQIAKMVHELSARHALPRDIVEGVSERTGGVPLFVEEVTRLLLERGEQGGAQAVPPTLQQSLAARLDRLGSARETAQIGAVLGRGFSYALLQSVAGLDEDALQAALERLAEADILFVEGDGAQATYRFKHTLIQDAAYDSLLKSRRQALHAQAAEILSESASPEPEAIAHHFTEAGLDDLAIEWWGKAGDQALRRSAFQEAISHLGKAIEMAEAAGAGEKEKAGGKLKLQVAYGTAMIAAHGHAAPETAAAFRRAHELAAGHSDVSERNSVNYGLWAGSYVRGELDAMRDAAQDLLADSASQPHAAEAGVAHRAFGVTQWFAGNFTDAHAHLEQALAIFDPERDRDLAFRFGQDVGVSAMAYLSIVLRPLGEPDRARELIDQASQLARDLGYGPSMTHPLLWRSHLEILRGDAAAALAAAEALAELALDRGMPFWRTSGEMTAGWARGRLRDAEKGAADLRRALAERAAQGASDDWLQTVLLAELEAKTLGAERALAREGHRFFDAWLGARLLGGHRRACQGFS
jgi:tetratricopeptide (TPR) repeat protein